MDKSVLGIDLGTSSLKLLNRYRDGRVVKVKKSYEEIGPRGWWKALLLALNELEVEDIAAIGLSSQVGTYLINGHEVISWNSPEGIQELKEIKEQYDRERFIQEIGMPHPDMISYPIPRLLTIKRRFERVEAVCQPKDFLCEKLTGKQVSDCFSWRGLAHPEKKTYSSFFLDAVGIEEKKLPRLKGYTEIAEMTKEIRLQEKLLPAGIPVYTGLNDYYASLLGMGIRRTGELFDLSGTSEHLGVVLPEMEKETKLVSGPYLTDYLHYGVTASSGDSLNFGLGLLKDKEPDFSGIEKKNPPVFLPYLKGERAPVWDMDARGVFFGISSGCTERELAYSVMEGVVFSLYHIYEELGMPPADKLITAGGAAVNRGLNQLKAEVFGLPVEVCEEKDTSALGAAMIAATGIGWYPDLDAATLELCRRKETICSEGSGRPWLRKRFELYKKLYPQLKQSFQRLKEVEA